MNGRRAAWHAVRGLALVGVVALVAGSVLGQPILLSYVETGSMAPTLSAGDGFVAVPPELAGPVEEGDVVVYEAKQLNGGGLTTHRVVGKTDAGFVTKGDANPFTDQDSQEPPVTRGQIRAVALQVGGSVVVLPGLGTAVDAVTGLAGAVGQSTSGLLGTGALQVVGLVVLGCGLVLYGLETVGGETRGRERTRPGRQRAGSGRRPHVFLLLLTLVMVAPVTAAMVVPSGPTEYGIVSAETDSPAPQVVRQGTAEDRTYVVRNGGVLPVVTYLESTSQGVETPQEPMVVQGGERVNATVTLSAPPETGYYVRSITEHRYLLLLPVGLLDICHDVHPWLPILVTLGVYGGGFYLLGAALLGSGQLRRREADKGSRLSRRLRRLWG
ncbi:S26 family signal peptidase [Haloglomus litoreum]|uniref:S26 family signal peptidase n=1 Tax=Haloglomus litoreum TaxID=3034026 RepID=UPI0023E75C58|nr:S26 family signal peptidase [Haloglomus sp. DT116]